MSDPATVVNLLSPHIDALLHHLLLAIQLPPRRRGLHDLGDVDLP